MKTSQRIIWDIYISIAREKNRTQYAIEHQSADRVSVSFRSTRQIAARFRRTMRAWACVCIYISARWMRRISLARDIGTKRRNEKIRQIARVLSVFTLIAFFLLLLFHYSYQFSRSTTTTSILLAAVC